MASESALKIATSFMVGQYLKIFQLIAAARNSHAQSHLWGNRNTNHSIMLIVKWIKLESQPPKKTNQPTKQTKNFKGPILTTQWFPVVVL